MNNSELNEILNEREVAMLFAHVSWCGPCKSMVPYVNEIAGEYMDKANVIDIDVEESPSVAEKYKIRNVPTLLFFKNGELADKIVGSSNKATMASKLDILING